MLVLALLVAGCQQDEPILVRDVRDISDGAKRELHWGEPDHGLRVGLAYDRVRDRRSGSELLFRVVLENVSDQPIKVLDPAYYTGGMLLGSSPLEVRVNGERRGPALISADPGTEPIRAYANLGPGESMAREESIDFDWWRSLKPPFTAEVVYNYQLDGEGIGIVHKDQVSWFEDNEQYTKVPELKRWFDDKYEYLKVTGLWKGKIESGVVQIEVQ